LGRLEVRLSEARLRWAKGDLCGAERALAAGLRALSSYQATLGSVELRVAGAGRAAEVMTFGLMLAAAARRPVRALWWMESVRTSEDAAASEVHAGPDLRAALVSLRDVIAYQERDDLVPREANLLRKRQSALEEVVRRHSRHAAGLGLNRLRPLGAKALAARLRGAALVEYASVGQQLVAVTLSSGSCRYVELAPLAQVRPVVAASRFALREATARPGKSGREALAETGRALQRLLFDPLQLDRTNEVVLVPDGSVALTPWALLPDLARVTVTVTTSASALLSGRTRSPLRLAEARVVAIAGPGLRHANEEVEAVKNAWHDRAQVLRGETACVAGAKEAMAHADVIHIAAHGLFRADSPLLSTVKLSDGHLTAYELAQVSKSARLVVLSCCDTGMSDTTGLGLSRLLTAEGAAAVVASVSAVSDASSTPLADAFHTELVLGSSPSAALTTARERLGGPLEWPSSAGFVCYGAGTIRVVASRLGTDKAAALNC
jgi:hypothetical protein